MGGSLYLCYSLGAFFRKAEGDNPTWDLKMREK